MSTYYNEINHYAAQWLRHLIAAGHIAPGDVDERSILEVQPDDLRGYTQCHFFAGIGGWSYALRLAGWPDDRPVWTGSCPCQPFSAAGKHRGSEDARHLWPAFFRLIRECCPGSVFGEQVAGAAGLAWLDHVYGDLESAGYAAAAASLPAGGIGAPHKRDRLYWVGTYSNKDRSMLCINESTQICEAWGQEQFERLVYESSQLSTPAGKSGALDDGLSRMLAGLGNAIVPKVAAAFVIACQDDIADIYPYA